jgi:hypothetical protein
MTRKKNKQAPSPPQARKPKAFKLYFGSGPTKKPSVQTDGSPLFLGTFYYTMVVARREKNLIDPRVWSRERKNMG